MRLRFRSIWSQIIIVLTLTMEESYLQLTLSVTVVSCFSPSFMARLCTSHLYRMPSSSFVGVMVNVLVVWWSFEPPRFTIACKGAGLPSRNHLEKNESDRRKCLIYHSNSLESNKTDTSQIKSVLNKLKKYIKKSSLRDCRIGWSTNAATCQLLLLFFSCDNDSSRCNEWWLWWCQHSQIVILLMNIVTSSLCFNSTLKSSIISTVWCIRNSQIINSLVGSVINSVKQKEISQLKMREQ